MKALYLEPDEEITSVIDRLREVDDEDIAIVVPKRAGLLQSIINLKLLRHQGERLKKNLSIVTTDKTGRNLASAVGITVYQSLPKGGKVAEAAVKEPAAEAVQITFRKGRRSTPEPGGTDQASAGVPPQSGAPPALTTKQIADEPATDSEPEPPAAKAETDAGRESVIAVGPATEQPRPAPRPARSGSWKPALPKLPRFKLPGLPALPKGGRFGGRVVAIAVAVLLLGGAAVAAVTLPRANITVTAKTDPLTAEIPVSFASRAVAPDGAGNVVPAKVIEVTVQASKQLATTGTKDAGAKASGQISVINTLSRAQPLVARTRFQAPDGRIYRSQSSVNVPPGGQAKVTITADDGGDAGNLPAGTRLTIPGLGGGSAVYGQANTALTGGTSTPSPEVSRDDANRARAELANEAARQGQAEAKGKLAVGFTLSDQTVATTVLSSSVDPPVGSAGPSLTITGQVRVAYFTYDDKELQKILTEDLGAKVPAGSDLVEESLSQTFVTGQTSGDLLSGVMRIDTFTAVSLSREQLARDIAGKDPQAAETLLRESGKVSDIRIDLWPFWVGSIPEAVSKITVHYRTAAAAPSPSPAATPTPAASPEGTPGPSLPPSL